MRLCCPWFWAKSHAESEPRRLSGSLANQPLFPFLPFGTFVPRGTRQVGRKAIMTVGSKRQDDRSHRGAETEALPVSLSVSQPTCVLTRLAHRVPVHSIRQPQTPRKGKPQEISRTVRCTCTFAGANPRDRVSNPHATPASRHTPRHRHARVSRKPHFPREAGPGQPRAQGYYGETTSVSVSLLLRPGFPPLLCCRTASRQRREAALGWMAWRQVLCVYVCFLTCHWRRHATSVLRRS